MAINNTRIKAKPCKFYFYVLNSGTRQCNVTDQASQTLTHPAEPFFAGTCLLQTGVKQSKGAPLDTGLGNTKKSLPSCAGIEHTAPSGPTKGAEVGLYCSIYGISGEEYSQPGSRLDY